VTASPRRPQRTHTNAAAAIAVVVLLLAGMQGASAGPRRVRLTGTYRPVAVDGFGWGRTDHYLRSGGETYLLQRGGDFPALAVGARIEVDGTLEGARLAVDGLQPVGSAPAPSSPRAAPRLATDTRSVLAILVNWTAPDSVTKASAINQLETVNDAWYDDASYGQVRMTADATNWLTIPTPSSCDSAATNAIMANARSVAIGVGWNVNAYDHLVVYFPTFGSCGWAGMGSIGGGQVWLNGYFDTRVTVHELGHNLGLWHAHSVTCTDSGATVSWSPTCARSEYGDPYDAMGNGFSGVGRFNAAQADQLDWMQGRKQAAAAGGGTYAIEPLEQSAEGLQALRLPGADHDIWVEYRRPTGIDSWLPSGATGGVLLHVPAPASVGGSDILDMTPATGDDFTDAALPIGGSWVDPVTDWAIHVDAAGPNAATVTVSKSLDVTPPTFTSAPHLSFASPQQLPKPGRPAQVRVSWAAKDPGGKVAGFDVRVAMDAGAWTTVAHGAPANWAAVAAAPGHTYATQVRAEDAWGNLSAWTDAPAISLTTSTERRLNYAGRWSRRHDRHALGHAYRLTTRPKASAVLRTTATAVAVLARVGPKFGSVRVYVDGRSKGTFSQHARRNGYRQITFRTAWAHAGSHTFRFVNVGTHGHPWFSIDGIALLG